MDEKHGKSNVVSMPIHPATLTDMIRTRAKKRSNIKLMEHALERQDLRDITIHDIHRVLDCGFIEGGLIEKGKHPGEWKSIVGYKQKGERKICVVTVVTDKSNNIYVLTVYWRDTL